MRLVSSSHQSQNSATPGADGSSFPAEAGVRGPDRHSDFRGTSCPKPVADSLKRQGGLQWERAYKLIDQLFAVSAGLGTLSPPFFSL